MTLITPHNAQPYLKSTFEEVWEYAGDRLTAVSENRFRSHDDYTQELFRTWQICRSHFNPYNTYQDTKMFPLLLRSSKRLKRSTTKATNWFALTTTSISAITSG